MAFWIIVALLCCIATATVLWPLLGARIAPQNAAAADRERRLAVYRDRRREIESERLAGRLEHDEADRAQRELVDEVADAFDDVDAHPTDSDGNAPRHPLTALTLAIAVPVLSLLVYQQVGTPGVDSHMSAVAATSDPGVDQVQAAIVELSARTRAQPDDGESWAMLAGAHKLIGEHAAAVPAFEKAIELLGPHPRLLSDLAESLAIGQGGRFAGRPTELLTQALRAEPRDAKANGLMGAAMFQAGDLAAARQHLQVLLDDMPADSPQAEQIRSVISKISSAAQSDGVAGSAPVQPPAPATQAADKPTAPGTVLVAGQIDIDPALRSRISANAAVFVNARSPTGSRMPFAAARLGVDAIPGRFALSDDQSMLAQRTLSQADEIVVEVRISASGRAGRSAGDLFGLSKAVKPGSDAARALLIQIDQVAP